MGPPWTRAVFCESHEPNPFLKQPFALIIPINLGTFNPSTLQFSTSEHWVTEALAYVVFSSSELVQSCRSSLSYKHPHFSYGYCAELLRFIISKLYWVSGMITC